jgi:hypothetical protein
MSTMKKKPAALPTTIVGLTPLELERKIPLADAAALNSIHPQTFRENYEHLLIRVGKRRDYVKLRDAIMLPPPDSG